MCRLTLEAVPEKGKVAAPSILVLNNADPECDAVSNISLESVFFNSGLSQVDI